MSFGPTNAPGFYSSMMRNFKEYWDLIFTQTLRSINTIANNAISVTATDKICHNKTKLVSGSRTNIDDILILCSNLYLILIYLECVYNYFSNIESASDLKNVIFSKLESDMLAMMSLKRGTSTLYKNLTLSTIGSYLLQGNHYSPSLG